MAIKHTAVSYYGINYVEHAIEDFKEMKEETIIATLEAYR